SDPHRVDGAESHIAGHVLERELELIADSRVMIEWHGMSINGCPIDARRPGAGNCYRSATIALAGRQHLMGVVAKVVETDTLRGRTGPAAEPHLIGCCRSRQRARDRRRRLFVDV